MLELETAVNRILAAMPAPVAQEVPLTQARGRVLLQSLAAPMDLPRFDNSAMDGYAVRAEDVVTATADAPIRLKIIAKIAAGHNFDGKLGARQCARIFTGSPLPPGADAVVMQEDTRQEPGQEHEVLILDVARPWENVRLRGEDVKAGAMLAVPGEPVTAANLGLFAAMGLEHVTVARRPVVGLLATGSELKEPGETLAPGQIYESNRTVLAELVRAAGAEPTAFPLVADSPDVTRAALENALARCDIIITSGGVSVGEMDFVKGVFEQMGGALDVWQVAIRPGKPVVFGRRGGKFLFGLPGNPVSAFVTFLLLARPALLRWQGAADVALPGHAGTLVESFANRDQRRHFVRVKVDALGKVTSAGAQASHKLLSLARANGLVEVPARTTLPKGSLVKVLRWE